MKKKSLMDDLAGKLFKRNPQIRTKNRHIEGKSGIPIPFFR